MKTISLICCLLLATFGYSQDSNTTIDPQTGAPPQSTDTKSETKEPKQRTQHDYSKSKIITLQANLGASYLPDGNSGVIAYGITGLFEKAFGNNFTIFTGFSYTEITDRENFRSFVSTDSIRQQHVKYKSVTIPVGVAFKYGQTKHRLYPLISVAVGPQFNIKSVWTAVKKVSFMIEGRAGIGVNVIKLVSFETGLAYHGSLSSVRSGDTRHPMLFGAFFGLNVNL